MDAVEWRGREGVGAGRTNVWLLEPRWCRWCSMHSFVGFLLRSASSSWWYGGDRARQQFTVKNEQRGVTQLVSAADGPIIIF